MRKLALLVTLALLANSAFAVNMSDRTYRALNQAGVSPEKIAQIKADLAPLQSVTKEQLANILSNAGVTEAQAAAATAAATGTTVATAGAAGALVTTATAIGLAAAFIAAAVAIEDAVNNNDDSTTGTI